MHHGRARYFALGRVVSGNLGNAPWFYVIPNDTRWGRSRITIPPCRRLRAGLQSSHRPAGLADASRSGATQYGAAVQVDRQQTNAATPLDGRLERQYNTRLPRTPRQPELIDNREERSCEAFDDPLRSCAAARRRDTMVIPDAGIRVSGGPRSGEQTNTLGEFDPGSGRTLAACLTHASQGAG